MTTINRNFVVRQGIDVSTTANVVGSATFSNTVSVTGNTTLSNTIAVTGNATFSNTIAVTGAATLSNTLNVTGNANVGGTLGVTGAATFSNTIAVTGNATVNGSVVLGDTDADNIAVNGSVNTSIIPIAGNTVTLGNTTQRWGEAWLGNVTVTTTASLANITTSGTTNLNGAVILGDAAADNISVTGSVNTNIVPVAGNTLSLGNTGQRWATVWANNVTATTNVDAQGITARDLTLTGNLTVSGTTTYLNTTSVDIGDAVIVLNADLSGATPPTEDAGFTVNRGSAANVSFLWDESNDRWKVGSNAIFDSTATVTGAATFSNTVSITGAANVLSTFGIGGAANALSTLGVASLTTLSGGVDVTGTANVTSTLNVGANVNLSTTRINVGNSSVNSVITSNNISIGSAVIANTDGAIINVSSSTDALRITQTGAGNALVVEDEANPDSTPFVIDTSGRVVVGANAYDGNWFTSGNVPTIWQVANTTNRSGFGSINYNGPGGLTLLRANGASVFTEGLVASGDVVGEITFGGYDGATSGALPAAVIRSAVDATPGTGSMPGRLTFLTTANGASTATERMRIRSDGNIGVGGSGSELAKFLISGTLTSSSNSSQSIRITSTIPNTATAGWSYLSAPTTEATAFTLSNLYHFSATPTAFGAGSTVTNQYGFFTGGGLTEANNNYAFFAADMGGAAATTGKTNIGAYLNVANATGGGTAWNLYVNGTAPSFFNSNVSITGSANVSSTLNVGANVSLSTTQIRVSSATLTTAGLLTVSNANITNTANVTSTLNVGANVNLSTTRINVGNSTVNSVLTSTAITVSNSSATATINPSLITIPNINITSTANVGANVNLSTTQLNVGNSTVNSTVTSTAVTSRSATLGGLTANATQITITGAATLSSNGGVGVAGQVLASNGATGAPYWVSPYATITDDNTTAATRYLTMSGSTSGNITSLFVASTDLTFNPSSGTLTAVVFSSSSDERTKENIQTIENAAEIVSKLRGVSFNRKNNKSRDYGVIAQEVEKVLPDIVTTDEEGWKKVSYDSIIGVLIEAIKDQQDQINNLKALINKNNP